LLDHPRTVYLREADLPPHLDGWLTVLFDPANLDATLDALIAASQDAGGTAEALRKVERTLANCQRQSRDPIWSSRALDRSERLWRRAPRQALLRPGPPRQPNSHPQDAGAFHGEGQLFLPDPRIAAPAPGRNVRVTPAGS
jgi:hypothetical protein